MHIVHMHIHTYMRTYLHPYTYIHAWIHPFVDSYVTCFAKTRHLHTPYQRKVFTVNGYVAPSIN